MRPRVRTIVAAVAILFALPLSASSADPVALGRDAYARESAGRQLEDRAESAGALGVFVDAASDEYVVVLPKAAGSNFRAADAADLGLKVRVETREITRDTIDRIEEALVALRPSFPEKHSYVFGFNAETGLVEVGSDAPRSAFADIERAFPGKISVAWGKLERLAGNYTADTPPHWGGAFLQSSSSGCTSGWTIRNQSSGTRYMVTAGHCFPNGTSTNMGTALRETAAYPAIDVELIRGKTYAGYIYADGATGERAVNDGNDPVLNSSYCITGRSSGFKCGWVVKGTGRTYCYNPEGCTFKLFQVRQNSGNAVFQEGDSGGPFYIKGATRVGIRGIAVARYRDVFGTWTSYVQGYKVISDYYVMPVVIP